jgi:hypothetical protein
MASKFFAGDDDNSHSDNDDHKSEASEKEKQVFKKTYFDSSSDEDEKRVVRSEKDKRFEAIRQVITKIKDKMRIKDFISISDEFDNLGKEFEKAKKVVDKEGIPIFYIRICYVLEQFVNTITNDEKKSMKKDNSTAFNKIKQRIKKHNKTIEDKINEFAKVPLPISPKLHRTPFTPMKSKKKPQMTTRRKIRIKLRRKPIQKMMTITGRKTTKMMLVNLTTKKKTLRNIFNLPILKSEETTGSRETPRKSPRMTMKKSPSQSPNPSPRRSLSKMMKSSQSSLRKSKI